MKILIVEDKKLLVSLAAFLALSMGLAGWAIRPVEQAWEQQKQPAVGGWYR